MKIAVIGSGIAGLSSAYHLDKSHDVVVYEKNNRLGGHTDTHSFKFDNQEYRIDSGFIIFCPELYPNFSSMLDELGVTSKVTDMSFGVHNEVSGLQYNATSLDTLFCDRKNILNPRFLKMLFDIVRFYQFSPKLLKHETQDLSVEDYLQSKAYSDAFKNDHFYPMVSALWSIKISLVKNFPIRYLIEFMKAHGLLKLINRPDWRVVKGGSSTYINALKDKLLNTKFRVNCGVTSVIREEDRVLIHSASHQPEYFDAVIIATHSDQARSILQKPSKKEYDILGRIPFQKNEVVVHTDDSVMPPNHKAWASWNVHIPKKTTKYFNSIYWMNSLQGLDLKENVFVNLNESRTIDTDKILKKIVYYHPGYSLDSVKARRRLHEINGKNRTFYAGAFWAWGFHEDGARTAREAVELLDKKFK